MTQTGTRIVVQSALRQLTADARARARLADDGSADHDFYEGVARAAEDIATAGRRQPGGWLDRESDAFQEGYLKTTTMIGTISHNPPIRFAVPIPDC